MSDVSPTRYCSYADFGEAFFRAAVTEDRIRSAIGSVAGKPIDFGPIGVGPGRVAQVTAHGDVGDPVVRSLAHDEVVFTVMLPVHLEFQLDLAVDKHRFAGELVVPITVHARATDDLRIVIDVTPPAARDIRMDLKAEGLRASVVQKAAGVDGEVKKFVAKYLAREVANPEVAGLLEIDVMAGIDATWERLGR